MPGAGPLVRSSAGPLVRWSDDLVVPCCSTGPRVYLSARALVNSSVASLLHWSEGLLLQIFAGPLVHSAGQNYSDQRN